MKRLSSRWGMYISALYGDVPDLTAQTYILLFATPRHHYTCFPTRLWRRNDRINARDPTSNVRAYPVIDIYGVHDGSQCPVPLAERWFFASSVLPWSFKSRAFRISFPQSFPQLTALASASQQNLPFQSVVPLSSPPPNMRSILFTAAWTGCLLGLSAFAPSFALPLLVKRSPVGVCPPVDPGVRALLLPDSEDCHVFYDCVNGIPFNKRCPANLYFNTLLQSCDELEFVDCLGESIWLSWMRTVLLRTLRGLLIWLVLFLAEHLVDIFFLFLALHRLISERKVSEPWIGRDPK